MKTSIGGNILDFPGAQRPANDGDARLADYEEKIRNLERSIEEVEQIRLTAAEWAEFEAARVKLNDAYALRDLYLRSREEHAIIIENPPQPRRRRLLLAVLIIIGLVCILGSNAKSETFRNAQGHIVGTASTNSGTTTFRNSQGHQTGTARTNNGTTTYRNSQGHMIGTARR